MYTYSTHTLYSLPAVRSMSIGPCFLSHTGQAVEWLYGPRWEGGGVWLIARKPHEEVSKQFVEPIRNRPGNSVITLRGNSLFTTLQCCVCDGFYPNTRITEQGLMTDLNWMFARLGVSCLQDWKWSDTYSHPVAGVIGQNWHQMIVITSSESSCSINGAA